MHNWTQCVEIVPMWILLALELAGLSKQSSMPLVYHEPQLVPPPCLVHHRYFSCSTDFDAMAEHRHQPLLSAATGAGKLTLTLNLIIRWAARPSNHCYGTAMSEAFTVCRRLAVLHTLQDCYGTSPVWWTTRYSKYIFDFVINGGCLASPRRAALSNCWI